MNVNIETSWNEELKEEFSKIYFQNLTQFVKDEYKSHKCFPQEN